MDANECLDEDLGIYSFKGVEEERDLGKVRGSLCWGVLSLVKETLVVSIGRLMLNLEVGTGI